MAVTDSWITAGDVIDGLRGRNGLVMRVGGASLLSGGASRSQTFAPSTCPSNFDSRGTQEHINRRNLYLAPMQLPIGPWEEVVAASQSQQKAATPPRFSALPRLRLPQRFEIQEYRTADPQTGMQE